MRRIFHRKFPDKLPALDRFPSTALFTLELVPMPTSERELEAKIRDAADRPILRAAIDANVDILLTGDGDFLESGITNPLIMPPSEFVQYH